MSDDRKYRQRGYQDSGQRGPKGPRPPKPPQERAPGRVLQDASGPKTPNLMSAHEVFRCARSAKLPARVAPKDERNDCVFFTPRTTVERQTSTPGAPSGETTSARKAFDDLFK